MACVGNRRAKTARGIALALLALLYGSVLLRAQTREASCATQSDPVEGNSHDGLFLGVPLGAGNTEVMHLTSAEKKPQAVRIETYSAGGCVLQAIDRVVPGGRATDVRLDLAPLKPGYGWIRVRSKTKGINVTSSQEVLRGDTLSTVKGRHPTFRGPQGRLTRTNHRWTMNLSKDPSVLEYFVNLSEHPVQVGICEGDKPDFFCKALSHTVGPLAQVAFRIDRSRRYLVLESTPGYSAAMGITFVDGNKQVFDSSSSIQFDESAPEK